MITEDELVTLLKVRCEMLGLRTYCRKHGINPGNASNIIAGKKPMIKSVAKALGYQPKTIYERIP